MLARLLTRRGNRVGALLYGTDVDTVLPARGGRVHVLELLQRMAARPAETAAGATDLRELLLAAQRTIKRRSTLFVVSDFISAPGWETRARPARAAPRGDRGAPVRRRSRWTCPTSAW